MTVEPVLRLAAYIAVAIATVGMLAYLCGRAVEGLFRHRGR